MGRAGVLAYLERFAVPSGSGRWMYALGGALLVMLVFEACTGLLLFFYYRLELPHASVANIVEQVRYGWLIRSLHHTGAHATVALALLHAATTFVRRAFRAPREVTWWTGGLLGLAIALFAYTGAILPWNQTSLYAAQVGTTLIESIPLLGGVLAPIMRGGATIGQETVQRAFALHVGVAPCFLLFVGTLHLYLVHAHGLQAAPLGSANAASTTLRSFLPRAALTWLVLLNVVVVAGALAPTALEPAADLLTPSTGGARPAWYFMAVFQLARSPAFGGSGITAVISLVAAGVVLAAAPWWAGATRGWRGPRSMLAVGLALVLGFLALTFAGYGG